MIIFIKHDIIKYTSRSVFVISDVYKYTRVFDNYFIFVTIYSGKALKNDNLHYFFAVTI